MNQNWYKYVLSPREIEILEKAEPGITVLGIYETYRRVSKKISLIRYIYSGIVGLIVAIIPILMGKQSNWLIEILAFIFISLIFFGWSWFIITPERQSEIKMLSTVFHAIVANNDSETEIGAIIRKMTMPTEHSEQ